MVKEHIYILIIRFAMKKEKCVLNKHSWQDKLKDSYHFWEETRFESISLSIYIYIVRSYFQMEGV